ncbi:Abi-alpha family protein [Bradyrhizobium lablabi]|uniref:Abi-alpha family protein n=1 Tax=Bradyrhizobium lablabi TaxID=722472 RepID=UPI00090B2EF1|nr:Abi-alpha family protein [Bradyrhizobium lablabi]SHM37655.1 protein of unknown function [Bradyrhizobium lablabi]
MSDEAPKDLTTEFAVELAKQFPIKNVYDDALKPSAAQAGQILQDIVKTIQLALAPLQIAGAYQDRLRAFIDRSVRAVPEKQRVSPPPQILGPIVEGIRYEPEGTPIDEMFSRLLSSSLDSERLDRAHPAFPAIIRQLSADEAKILTTLKGTTFEYVHSQPYNRATNLFGAAVIEKDALPTAGLVFPNKVPFYVQHLNQLGLAGIFQVGNQEALFDAAGQQNGVRVRSQYRLMDFGQAFVEACT